MEGKKVAELAVYNLEDRLNVAAILFKNGYKVSQGKRLKTPTGKQVDYIIFVEEVENKVEIR